MTTLNERLVKAAAEEGKNDEIAALLDQGADIDFAGRYYRTPLMKAIEWGSEAVVRALLKRGADVEAKGWREHRPLHKAASGGLEDFVRLLVTEYGAQINARDNNETPLMLALLEGHEGVASFLLSAGADASISTTAGWNALHCACEGGLTGLAGRLLNEFGLDLHAKTIRGESCLHFAASQGRVETCRPLLERGLSVDNLDDRGKSPLMMACILGHAFIVELLLDHGADIEHQDNDGYAPLCSAIEAHSKTAIIVLVERGARLDVPLPRHFPSASLEEGMASVLKKGFLKTLLAEPDTPIPPYRRVLRWALTSPAVAALVQEKGWSLLGTAKTEEEVEEMIKRRLGLLEDDAWKRRMHLVIDRALDWGYGNSGKAQEEKRRKYGGGESGRGASKHWRGHGGE